MPSGGASRENDQDLIEVLPASLFEDALQLWRETGLTRPWNDPRADLQRALAGPASTVLAVVDGGKLLATAMVGHDGHRGWVYYLAVAPEQQRRGLGRAMMAACEAWLIERRVPKLNLMVRAENGMAWGFYEALGYAIDDVVVRARRLDLDTA
jgi:ribosomal protein S18 acetylase RimI-like enzyme